MPIFEYVVRDSKGKITKDTITAGCSGGAKEKIQRLYGGMAGPAKLGSTGYEGPKVQNVVIQRLTQISTGVNS